MLKRILIGITAVATGFASLFTNAQPGTGLPVWSVSTVNSQGFHTIDWRTSTPAIQHFDIPSPSSFCPAVPAVSNCGEPVFYVRQSGMPDASNNLFIYAPDGSILLDSSTPNGPGLNAKRTGYEFQVIKVPQTLNEWYIIYSKWVSDAGAPLGNGGYIPSNLLYSRVRFRCGEIEVLERDIVLKAGGVSYTYSVALAVAATSSPDVFYLYANRRSESNNYLSLDRFIIDNGGIYFDKNTGNITAPYSIFAVDASPLVVSNDSKRIALCNRNAGTDDIDFILFDADDFSNAPGSCQEISAGDLILQPDGQVLFTAMSVQMAASSVSQLDFLEHMERKIVQIAFSPSGKYLYFTHGGFNGTGSNDYTYTYLGQIEIGIYGNPQPYPYKVRLQIEEAPYLSGNSTTAGSREAFDGTRHIQQCFDGNMYYYKWTTPYINVLPNPDSVLPNNLIPYKLNLSDSNNPNIGMNGSIWYGPDQIDGFDYLTSVSPVITLGNDSVICEGAGITLSPGGQFESYCWQDGSSDPVFLATESGDYWVEVIDEFGCFARDTIVVSTVAEVINLGADMTVCSGEEVYLSPGTGFSEYLWQDGSSYQSILVNDSGSYWVEVIAAGGCTARDTIDISLNPLPEVSLGQDTIIEMGTTLELDAGPGYASYFWQDGSLGRYFEVDKEGTYWVTVRNSYCEASDTIYIIVDDCIASLTIPNCFTPNGDGYNDRFNVKASNLVDFTLLIFNRWGQQIFETDDISEGWDGKVNGNISAVGTYFYMVRYSTECSSGVDKSGKKAGSVTLLE